MVSLLEWFLNHFNKSSDFGQYVTNSLFDKGGGLYWLTVQSLVIGMDSLNAMTLVGLHPGVYISLKQLQFHKTEKISGFDSL